MSTLAIPRCDTAERPPSGPVSTLTGHVLYRVASTDGDDEFFVWAESAEAVVSVIFMRSDLKRLPPIFRGIRVMR
jgi:hypothetical protein